MTTELTQRIHELYQDYPEIPYVSPDRDFESWFHKVTLKTESLVPKRNMKRTSEGLLPGDIILLWRISLGTYTTESWTPKYFEYDYGICCEESLQMLIEKGYAEEFTAKNSLNYVAAPILKALLKDKQIKGLSKLNKEALIELTSETFTEDELAQAISIRGYGLTAQGKAAIDNNVDIIERHPKKNL